MIPRFLTALVLSALVSPYTIGAETPTAEQQRPRAVIATSLGDITVELFADQAPETVTTFLALAEGTRAFTDANGQEVTRPFYDGLTFHRVIPGFMIQGGCPRGDGSGSPGFTFGDEINADSLGLDQEMALQGEQLHPQCGYMGQQFGMVVVRPLVEAKGISPTSTPDEQQAAIRSVMPALQQISLKQFYEALGYRYNSALPPSSRPLTGSLAMANSGPATNGSQFFINLGDTPHLTGKHTVFGRVVSGMDVVERIGQVERGDQDRPKKPVTITSIRRLAPDAVAGAPPPDVVAP